MAVPVALIRRRLLFNLSWARALSSTSSGVLESSALFRSISIRSSCTFSEAKHLGVLRRGFASESTSKCCGGGCSTAQEEPNEGEAAARRLVEIAESSVRATGSTAKPSEAELELLTKQISENAAKIGPGNVSLVLLALARLRFRPPDGVLRTLAETVASIEYDKVSSRELVSAIWALGYLEPTGLSGFVLQKLGGLVVPALAGTLVPGEVAKLLWGLSKLSVALDEPLFTEDEALRLGEMCDSKLKELSFSTVDALTLLWSISAVRGFKMSTETVSRVLGRLDVEQMSAEQIKISLASARRLGANVDTAWLQGAVGRVTKTIGSVSPAAITGLLDELSELSRHSTTAGVKEAYKAAAMSVAGAVSGLQSAGSLAATLRSSVWDSANKGTEAFSNLASSVEKNVGLFDGNALATSMLSFAKVDFEAPKSLMSRLEGRFMELLPTSAPSVLSANLLAMGALKHKLLPLTMEKAKEHVMKSLSQFRPSDFAATLSALARLEQTPEDSTVKAVKEAGMGHLDAFTVEEVATMLKALEAMGDQDQKLLQKLRETAVQKAKDEK